MNCHKHTCPFWYKLAFFTSSGDFFRALATCSIIVSIMKTACAEAWEQTRNKKTTPIQFLKESKYQTFYNRLQFSSRFTLILKKIQRRYKTKWMFPPGARHHVFDAVFVLTAYGTIFQLGQKYAKRKLNQPQQKLNSDTTTIIIKPYDDNNNHYNNIYPV